MNGLNDVRIHWRLPQGTGCGSLFPYEKVEMLNAHVTDLNLRYGKNTHKIEVYTAHQDGDTPNTPNHFLQ